MLDNNTYQCDFYKLDMNRDFLKNNPQLFIPYNQGSKFKIYNPNNNSYCYLSISIRRTYDGREVLEIKGSMRKWYFGNTIDDFSQNTFKKACHYLFSLLNIPTTKMKYFKVSRIEVGLNIKISIPPTELEATIIEYKSNWYKDSSTTGRGRKFKTKNKSVIIYDKIEEIKYSIKKNRDMNTEQRREALHSLGKYSNIVRIEFSSTLIKNVVTDFCVQNLQNCIDKFSSFYTIFWKKIQNIRFGNSLNEIIQFNPSNKVFKNLRDHLAYIGLHIYQDAQINNIIKQMNNSNHVQRKINKLKQVDKELYKHYSLGLFHAHVKVAIIHSLQKSNQSDKFLSLIYGSKE